jgi:hypothetical protein
MTASPLDHIEAYLSHLRTRVSTSVSTSVSSIATLSARDYIRLVTIIGAYCLLRPYLLKLSARFQTRDHERELDLNEASSAAAVNPRGRASVAKDGLLGQVDIPEDSESEEDGEGGTTGADWGKGARRRQRVMLRRLLDEEEKRRVEELEGRENKDIEEFLIKE